ncbi:hypothetical protein L6R52_10020 [Myxococcota bacterium]|nr:hypothetical protein [Myxococcota bacterium]
MSWVAFGVLALAGVAVYRAVRDTSERHLLDALAQRLALAPGEGAAKRLLVGERDGLRIVVQPHEYDAGTHVVVSVGSAEGARSIANLELTAKRLRNFVIRRQRATNTAAAEKRRARPFFYVRTADPALDATLYISGLEDEVLALLDSTTRAQLAEVATDPEVFAAHRELSFGRPLRGTADALTSWVLARVELASRLRELDVGERRARLLANVRSDPSSAVRACNLEALLKHHPMSDEATAALDHARSSSAPELQLAVAIHVATVDGDPSMLTRLEAEETLDEELRGITLMQLACTSPVGHVDLFARSLASTSELIQLAAVGGLNMLDLSLVPLDALVDRFEELSPAAREAALRMFTRVPEEGRALPADLRGRVIDVLIRHGVTLPDAEAGRVTIVSDDASGALSYEDRAGQVSRPSDDEGR